MNQSQRPQRKGIMLAYPTEPGRIQRLANDTSDRTFLVQPKLNGERCWVDYFKGESVLLSSYGNVFLGLDHIHQALKQLPPSQFDGELYVHGWNRERIHSAVSRKTNFNNEDTKQIQFHIFDYKSDSPQVIRTAAIWEYLHPDKPHTPHCLVPVPTFISNEEKWQEQASFFTQAGYEGIILRSMNAPYSEKRSVKLLKFKPTYKDEYTILDTKEAISQEGIPKGTLGAFTVISDDNTPFDVGAGKLTHTERDSLWNSREELPGKMLLVKHEKITTNSGIPVCAVAVEVLA